MIELTDKSIIITIERSILPQAAEVAFDNEYGYECHKYFIEDKNKFLKSMYYELCREEENGDTLVHKMLDKAVINCL